MTKVLTFKNHGPNLLLHGGNKPSKHMASKGAIFKEGDPVEIALVVSLRYIKALAYLKERGRVDKLADLAKVADLTAAGVTTMRDSFIKWGLVEERDPPSINGFVIDRRTKSIAITGLGARVIEEFLDESDRIKHELR